MKRPSRFDDPHMPARALLGILLALVAAVAAAALATGCGAGGAGAVIDPVAKAAENTSASEGARVAMHMQVDVAGLGSRLTMDAHGRESFKAGEGEIDLEMNGLPAAAAAAGLGNGVT